MVQKSFENKIDHKIGLKIDQGWWAQEDLQPECSDSAIKTAIYKVAQPVFLLSINGRFGVARGGTVTIGDNAQPDTLQSDSAQYGPSGYPLCAYVPPLHPENLGAPAFKKKHGLRYAYVAGAMANGITSVEMVRQAGGAGMIGFLGAAGLSLSKIEEAIDSLQKTMGTTPFGFNLIHTPSNPEIEAAVVDLYLRKKIRLVSASAYMNLTLALVFFRVKGIHRDDHGNIICPNKIIAKVSRVEVAERFFSPPPEKLLAKLVDMEMITRKEASYAQSIPMADDLTAEADSGGHTDNRPAITLLPTMLAMRNKMAKKYNYNIPLCVGLGGGIATPASTAAAFAMGAGYVLTGSVNQACVEAGTSDTARLMLAQARQADVTMAPAADMFEMGIKAQVLKRGTMFPLRAAKLYDIYCRYDGLENIPEKQRIALEREIFRRSFEDEWEQTKIFFKGRDPGQIKRAQENPRHKMALVFRSYLGRSSDWATTGDLSRKIDYQICCGPSMGAFNEWTRGSFLENPENRKVVTIAMNLLFGASVITRINLICSQGIKLSENIEQFVPMKLSEISEYTESI